MGEKACARCPRYCATKSWDDESKRYHPTTGDLHLVWDIPYEKGTIRAEGYMGDKLVKTALVETTGAIERLSADIRELGKFYGIEVSACDKEDRVVPTADIMIEVNAEDNTELIGMDSGNMLDLTSFRSNKRAMLAGKVLVVICKKDQNKEAMITISSAGIKELRVEL